MKIEEEKNKLKMKNLLKKNKFIFVIGKVVLILLCLLSVYNIFYVTTKAITSRQYIEIFGYYCFVMPDKSMENQINKMDFVIAKKINSSGLQVGNIVIFEENSIGDKKLIAHRIAKMDDKVANGNITTKGDNNYYNDVRDKKNEEILGKVVINLPIVGFFANIFESPVVTFAIIFILLVFAYFNKEFEKRRTLRNRKKQGYINV